MGIRTKLIPLLLAIAVVPMLAMGWIAYTQARTALTNSAVQSLRGLATEQETRLNDLVALYQRRINFISMGTDLPGLVAEGADPASLGAPIAEVRRLLVDLEAIAVTDPTGRILASSLPNEVGRSVGDTEYFREGMGGRIRPEVAHVDGRLLLKIAGPLTLDGRPVGGVILITPAPVVENLAHNQNGLGQSGEYRLVRRGAGRTVTPVVASRLSPNVDLGSGETELTKAALENREADFPEATDYRGRPVLAATRHIDTFGWGLVAKQDRSEALRPVTELQNILALVGLIVLILTILIIVELTYAISAPLIRLTRLAQQLGRGKFDLRVPVRSSDEIGQLSASVNAMAERLSKSQKQLEERVRERTRLAETVSTRNRDLKDALGRLSRTRGRVRHQALHDSLTQLPNRLLFEDRLKVAIRHADRNKTGAAVLFLDLDRFKGINDSLGHFVGDAVLQAVATQLVGCVRKEDTVARFGGDEFIVLLNETPDKAAALKAARKIQKGLREPLKVRGSTFHLDASIGISLYPEHGADSETLLRNADTALYRAKAARRKVPKVYDKRMSTGATKRMKLENDLRDALKQREFVVHYQPVVSQDRTLVGAEALVRWNHPRAGLVFPDEFIPYAEDMGMSKQIGEQVLEQVADRLKVWNRPRGQSLRVAVNVSALQFSGPELVDSIKRVAKRTGAPLKQLEVEITEGVALQDFTETRRKLKSLRRLGVSVALDDFGTGHSSLQYLRELPIDTLKIDGSFVQNSVRDERDLTLVAAMIAIGRSHGLSVIAEGVETKEVWDAIAAMDVDGLQGYYFSKALPADRFEEALKKWKR